MLKHFLHDRRGATAVLFTLCLIPVVGAIGFAVDYGRASKERAKLQMALDSAAIATAKLPPTTPYATLRQNAQDFFDANYKQRELRDIVVTVVDGGATLTLSATGVMDNHIMPVLGKMNESVSATVGVARPFRRKLELALALDNTGSMAGTKISELQKAVKLLLDILQPTIVEPDDVKVSIVPFARFVKVPVAQMQTSWLEKSPPHNWSGCLTDRNQPNDAGDTAPVAGSVNTLYWWRTATNTNTPVDCGNLTTIQPLTTDFPTLYAKATQMVAAGNTNVTIGVVWGWHTLSPGNPMTGGSGPTVPDVIRAMIVLTDGENTQNRWTSSVPAIDARTTAVCDSVKSDGIQIYTVRVIDGDINLLRDCASDPSKFFDVQNATQLSTVFSQIATNLAQLRLTR
jgi:Flp pilus assembly protein TadG